MIINRFFIPPFDEGGKSVLELPIHRIKTPIFIGFKEISLKDSGYGFYVEVMYQENKDNKKEKVTFYLYNSDQVFEASGKFHLGSFGTQHIFIDYYRDE